MYQKIIHHEVVDPEAVHYEARHSKVVHIQQKNTMEGKKLNHKKRSLEN